MSDRLTPAQIRGARAMLDWSMTDLAQAAGVSVLTVKRAGTDSSAPLPAATMGRLRSAFAARGVEFLADEGNGPGMRLRPHQASPFSRLL